MELADVQEREKVLKGGREGMLTRMLEKAASGGVVFGATSELHNLYAIAHLMFDLDVVRQ